jgi:DNA-binding protein HU-beta
MEMKDLATLAHDAVIKTNYRSRRKNLKRLREAIETENRQETELQFNRILQDQSKKILDQLFDPKTGVIVKVIREQQELQIPRFGKFRHHVRPKRQGRDPRTGQTVQLKTKETMKFKASLIVERTLTRWHPKKQTLKRR